MTNHERKNEIRKVSGFIRAAEVEIAEVGCIIPEDAQLDETRKTSLQQDET
jgi:hypothetical protein